jgi:hypothetical protein
MIAWSVRTRVNSPDNDDPAIGLRTLALRGATPLEGGIPLTVDGKIVGAIGASGATSAQDGQVAKGWCRRGKVNFTTEAARPVGVVRHPGTIPQPTHPLDVE